MANGVRVLRSNFGAFGAFVPQEDVLLSTMTPRECFEFAARLRNVGDEDEIE